MATTKVVNNRFKFTKEEFYAAKRVLHGGSDLGVWCYLADGNAYDKKAIADLNGVTERSVARSLIKLKELGYYVNDIFYATPRASVVYKETSSDKIVVSGTKELIIPVFKKEPVLEEVPTTSENNFKWKDIF